LAGANSAKVQQIIFEPAKLFFEASKKPPHFSRVFKEQFGYAPTK
jgi:hypothetical protein